MLPRIPGTVLCPAGHHIERFRRHKCCLLYTSYELSGGEKQRVAICRALINDPSVILADEPTGNLDSKSSQNVIDSLVKINEEYGKTILMVTHDPIVASYCKKIMFLKDGEILGTVEKEKDRETFYQRIIGKMKELQSVYNS